MLYLLALIAVTLVAVLTHKQTVIDDLTEANARKDARIAELEATVAAAAGLRDVVAGLLCRCEENAESRT